MRYVIFWAVIGMLLAARVAYYDEIRPNYAAGPDARSPVQSSFDLAETAPVGAADGASAPVRLATGR